MITSLTTLRMKSFTTAIAVAAPVLESANWSKAGSNEIYFSKRLFDLKAANKSKQQRCLLFDVNEEGGNKGTYSYFKLNLW